MTGPESAGLPPGRYRWVLEDDPVTGRHSRTRLYLARDLSTEALIRVRDAAAAELVRRDVCGRGGMPTATTAPVPAAGSSCTASGPRPGRGGRPSSRD